MMGGDGASYDDFYPYYAEICALSELRKKTGFGVPVSSGIGGHGLLYLHGVRKDRDAAHPTLQICPPGVTGGVGISVNAHYRNANWVAAEGPEFLWRGALRPGERLTREAYERTQHHAKQIGVLDGVEFHEHLFRDKPPGMSERDYMYEISVATDYAACFGRDVYRARIPLDRAGMAAIVDYLNALNAPYRGGTATFQWRLFNNNCAHVTHNALAAARVCAPWPTGQFFLRAAFRFPVPKNEFVDFVLRANDLPIHDAEKMFQDHAARDALLNAGFLPTAPGALAVASPVIGENDVYDSKKLRLIFYDNPFWGPYRFRFARIFKEPRYRDLRANLRHFVAVYAKVPPDKGSFSGERARFQQCHDAYIARQSAMVARQLARLEHAAAPEQALA